MVGEHDELGPGASGHEELYVVVSGGCTFTVDGEEFEAPQGTAVFVGDPAAKRTARATEDGTVVLASAAVPARRSSRSRRVDGDLLPPLPEQDYEGALRPAARRSRRIPATR